MLSSNQGFPSSIHACSLCDFPTWVEIRVHKVVSQEHAQVRIEAQRDDLSVERHRTPDIVRDTLPRLERLDEDVFRGPQWTGGGHLQMRNGGEW